MCHVLIIEDERLVALHIHMLLAETGLSSVDFAETEEEAVVAARAHKPAVITSDVHLRYGTGPNAVRAIHGEHGPIPVIYITATPEDCVDCPPEHTFSKPVDEGRLQRLFSDFAVG